MVVLGERAVSCKRGTPVFCTARSDRVDNTRTLFAHAIETVLALSRSLSRYRSLSLTLSLSLCLSFSLSLSLSLSPGVEPRRVLQHPKREARERQLVTSPWLSRPCASAAEGEQQQAVSLALSLSLSLSLDLSLSCSRSRSLSPARAFCLCLADRARVQRQKLGRDIPPMPDSGSKPLKAVHSGFRTRQCIASGPPFPAPLVERHHHRSSEYGT